MSKDNRNRKTQLALALAGGESIVEWARKNGVAERTAYRWSVSPEVRSEVDVLRAAAIERAVGRLAENTATAAERIVHLAENAASESVQLQACRAVLNEFMGLAGFSSIERRMTEIERRLAERSPAWDGGARPAGGARSCPAY